MSQQPLSPLVSPPRAGHAVLLGPPNVGKSTLMNALLGEKLAIVTPKPQTTRTQIAGIYNAPGLQIVFLDTPGIHQRKGRLNKTMLQAAWQSLHEADVVVAVLDAAKAVEQQDRGGLERQATATRDRVLASGLPVVVALNKSDAVKDKRALLPLLQQAATLFPDAEVVPLSARREDGLDRLVKAIAAHLPEGEALYPEDQLSTAPQRFLAAEIVREKLFLALRQEVPYSVAVDVETWEQEADRARIHAVIYVGREGHKGMVIGRQGQTLREIGTTARTDIEDLLQTPVHLELFVKVKEDWTEDPGMLRELGYQQ